ncbi:MAG: HD domain-containing protein [Desulfobacterales bacterium]
MKSVVDLLFEARSLKDLIRSGYRHLGCGDESVAEHVYGTTFIAYVMSRLEPDADPMKLLAMCLVHDLPEARLGDMNHLQKFYVTTDEPEAVADMTRELPFGAELADLIEEFNSGSTLEAKLAHDADQLSLILELKSLSDLGHRGPDDWIRNARRRLRTALGRRLCDSVLEGHRDHWWRQKFVDKRNQSH